METGGKRGAIVRPRRPQEEELRAARAAHFTQNEVSESDVADDDDGLRISLGNLFNNRLFFSFKSR